LKKRLKIPSRVCELAARLLSGAPGRPLGTVHRRGETIQPRAHFLIASRYRECR
jgi:hypothetical protein